MKAPATIHAADKDLDRICRLFEKAIAFQQANHYIGWQEYDRSFLEADIRNGLLYKMVTDDAITCIFSICYNDRLIWREMDKGNALYLHRVVSNRPAGGGKVFPMVLNWAVQHAAEKQLEYIRMDTWASNEKIINYYKSFGFRLIENYTTPGTVELPPQHRNLEVALLELPV